MAIGHGPRISRTCLSLFCFQRTSQNQFPESMAPRLCRERGCVCAAIWQNHLSHFLFSIAFFKPRWSIAYFPALGFRRYLFISPGILSDILSGILSGILSDIYSDVLFCNLSSLLFGIYSSILSGICSDMNWRLLRTPGRRLLHLGWHLLTRARPCPQSKGNEEEEEEGGRRRRRRRKGGRAEAPSSKSRGSRLAGAEKG